MSRRRLRSALPALLIMAGLGAWRAAVAWTAAPGVVPRPAALCRGSSPLSRVASGPKCARAASGSPSDPKAALETLAQSALTREEEPEAVFDAIRVLEKARKEVDGSNFEKQLTGSWRLVYTTGTKQTEGEVGRINYVPIVAVQTFDMEKRFIRNGVYLGPLTLEFEGKLTWIQDRLRLEFDFDELKLCGFSVPLPDALRSTLGMKSSTPYKRQPAFDFVAADEKIMAARGAGGGVALWLRNELA